MTAYNISDAMNAISNYCSNNKPMKKTLHLEMTVF